MESLIKKIKEIFRSKSLIEHPSKHWFLNETIIGVILIIVLVLTIIFLGKFFEPNSTELNQLNNEYLIGIRKAYSDCRNAKSETGVRKFTENYCRDTMQKSLKELGY